MDLSSVGKGNLAVTSMAAAGISSGACSNSCGSVSLKKLSLGTDKTLVVKVLTEKQSLQRRGVGSFKIWAQQLTNPDVIIDVSY